MLIKCFIKYLLNKERSYKLFYDISNAYICVNLNTKKKLMSLNIGIQYIEWILNFLTICILQLGSKSIIIQSRLPQGSILWLGYRFFNIYTARLHLSTDTNTHIYQYANENNLQIRLNKFINECTTFDQMFNTTKTYVIYIRKCLSQAIDITINNRKIEQVTKLKTLSRTCCVSHCY